MTEDDQLLLDHLIRTALQWHPNKKADAWVASALYYLKMLRAEVAR